MYAYINGRVDTVLPDRAILEAGGVGYELLCSGNTLRTLSQGAQKRLWTHLYLAEGIMALYGFADTEERDMFRRLIGVTPEAGAGCSVQNDPQGCRGSDRHPERRRVRSRAGHGKKDRPARTA